MSEFLVTQSTSSGSSASHSSTIPPPVSASSDDSAAKKAPEDLAEHFKARADELYRRKLFDQAQSAYLDAISALPPRPSQSSDNTGSELASRPALRSRSRRGSVLSEKYSDESDSEAHHDDSTTAQAEGQSSTVRSLEESARVRHLRAVLYANLAAAALGGEHWSEAVEAATNALEDEPNYVKALHRRATAYSKLGGLQELRGAICDYDNLLAIPDTLPLVTPAAKAGWRDARDKLAAQADHVAKEETERMTKEGIAALRSVGDALLSPFGWSTRDFGLQQQEGGGYSININRGGPR